MESYSTAFAGLANDCPLIILEIMINDPIVSTVEAHLVGPVACGGLIDDSNGVRGDPLSFFKLIRYISVKYRKLSKFQPKRLWWHPF